MHRSFRGVAALLFASATPVFGQTPNTLAADAAAFGARESVAAVDLSADGSSVLYLTPGPGRKSVAVLGSLATGKFAEVARSDGAPEDLRWCAFSSPSRAVCRIRALVRDPGTGDLVGFARLLALDTNGGANPKMLGESASAYDSRLRQVDGEIIDWESGARGTVLMSRDYVPEEGKIGSNIVRNKNGVGVDRVNTSTLLREPVEPPRTAAGYMSDGRGAVRLMSFSHQRNSGRLTGRVKYLYRTAASREWRDLWEGDAKDFVPLAVDGQRNALFVLKKADGRNGLYSIALDGSMQSTLVANHPRVDIDDVLRIGTGQRVIGYTFAEEKRKSVYFDPEFKALAASLSKALPNLPLIDFVDASADGRKLLIVAASDSDPGRYYLFDRDRKVLEEAMLVRPQLKARALGAMKPVTIPAPDGTPIPAYLTLPPGVTEPKGLPAVVLPHGGPSARDEWGFDWLSQFLAAQGYVVVQPNYRGSSGFGDAWLHDNGFKSWRTSIGDISASARWLASQGIADPGRIAIVGWSYGGYAALQAAATDPSLYKAVVAIAPVTDLGLLKQDAQNFTHADLIDEFVGSGPHLALGSPVRNAAAINAPVLLVHGDMDANVRIQHSRSMDSALRSAGKTSELLTFRGLDHRLEDSDARTNILTRIGALLGRTIGK